MAWIDTRDGAGTERVTLCPECHTNITNALATRRIVVEFDRFPIGVLAGFCDACGGAFCVCQGPGCKSDCPRRGAKLFASKLIVYVVDEAQKIAIRAVRKL